MLIDMHVHTMESDGKTHGDEAIRYADKQIVNALIFANHETNTIERLGDWNAQAELSGVKVWYPAIELTTSYRRQDSSEPCLFDVLLYGGAQDDSQFTQQVAGFTENEFEYYDSNVRNLAQLHGFAQIPISDYDHYIDPVTKLSHATTRVSRTQLGKLLEERSNLTVNDFKRKVPRKIYTDTPLNTMEIVRVGSEIGAIVVLAHPGTAIRSNKLSDQVFFRILKNLQKQGLMGIEVHHPKHPETLKLKLKKMAEELGLITTGGSDYHGREGEYVGKHCINVTDVEVVLSNLIEL